MPTVHYLPRNFLTQRGTEVPLVSVVPSSFNSRKRKRYFKSSYLSLELEGNEDYLQSNSNSNNFVFSHSQPRRSKSSKKTVIVTPQGKKGGRRSANNGAADEYELSSNNDSEVSDYATTTNGSVEEDDDNDSLPLMHLYRKEKGVAASLKLAMSEDDAVEGEDDMPLKEVWRKARRRRKKPKLLHDATKSSDKGYKNKIIVSPPLPSAPSTDPANGKELPSNNHAKPDGLLPNTAANNGGNSSKEVGVKTDTMESPNIHLKALAKSLDATKEYRSKLKQLNRRSEPVLEEPQQKLRCSKLVVEKEPKELQKHSHTAAARLAMSHNIPPILVNTPHVNPQPFVPVHQIPPIFVQLQHRATVAHSASSDTNPSNNAASTNQDVIGRNNNKEVGEKEVIMEGGHSRVNQLNSFKKDDMCHVKSKGVREFGIREKNNNCPSKKLLHEMRLNNEDELFNPLKGYHDKIYKGLGIEECDPWKIFQREMEQNLDPFRGFKLLFDPEYEYTEMAGDLIMPKGSRGRGRCAGKKGRGNKWQASKAGRGKLNSVTHGRGITGDKSSVTNNVSPTSRTIVCQSEATELRREVTLNNTEQESCNTPSAKMISTQYAKDYPLSTEEYKVKIQRELERECELEDFSPGNSLIRGIQKEYAIGNYNPGKLMLQEVQRDLGLGKHDIQNALRRDSGVRMSHRGGSSKVCIPNKWQVARNQFTGGQKQTSVVQQPQIRQYITPDVSRQPSPHDIAGSCNEKISSRNSAVGISSTSKVVTSKSQDLAVPTSELEKILHQVKLERGIIALKQYKLQHGNLDIQDTSELGKLVCNLRELYDENSPILTKKTRLDLDQLGFKSSGDKSINSIKVAHNLGFSVKFLEGKTEEEALNIINAVYKIRRQTRESSGFDASPGLAVTVQHAIALGFASTFLSSKTEGDIKRLVSSRSQKLRSEQTLHNKGSQQNQNLSVSSEGDDEIDRDDEINRGSGGCGRKSDVEFVDDNQSEAGSGCENAVDSNEDCGNDSSEQSDVERDLEFECSSDEELGGSDSEDEDIIAEIVEDSDEQSEAMSMAIAEIVEESDDYSEVSSVVVDTCDDYSSDEDTVVSSTDRPLSTRGSWLGPTMAQLNKERYRNRNCIATSSKPGSKFGSWMGKKKQGSPKPKPRRVSKISSPIQISEGINQETYYRTIGVKQVKSGNWEVKVSYHGARRVLGTFDSQNEAAVANKTGHNVLENTKKNSGLTVYDINQNVKLARDAALEAVQKFRCKHDTPPTDEDMFYIHLKSFEDDANNRPKLQPGLLQQPQVFDTWLAERKKNWGRKESSVKSTQVEKGNKQTSAIDYRTFGVKNTKSGKWQVRICYGKGNSRNIGTFDTLDEAAIANKIGRSLLRTAKSSGLTEEEMNENVKSARDAALEAANEFRDKHNVQRIVEDNIKEVAKDRTMLQPGQAQHPQAFGAWLAERKQVWRKQQSDTVANAKHRSRFAPTPTKTQAFEAVVPPDEDMFYIHLKSFEDDANNRPKLQPGLLQQPQVFDTWLAERKKNWGRKESPVKSTKVEKGDKQTSAIDYRTFGVQNTKSGKWQITSSMSQEGNALSLEPPSSASSPHHFANSPHTMQSPAVEDHHSSDEEKGGRSGKSRRELPADTVATLKAWLLSPEHLTHPYPTPQDQIMLMHKTGIDKKQIKNWFTNARRRIWKPMLKKQLEAGKLAAVRNIGTFDILDEAAIANKIGRSLRRTAKSSGLTEEKMNENVKSARDAALESANEFREKHCVQRIVEGNIKEVARDRTKLHPGQAQHPQAFGAWLAERKQVWRKQQSDTVANAKHRSRFAPTPTKMQAFEAFIQHRGKTLYLLKEASKRGEATVSTSDITQARAEYLTSFSGQGLSDKALAANIARAEKEAVNLFVVRKQTHLD